MIPINIYALTRISDEKQLRRLERQMSGRGRFLNIKKWETESLQKFCEHLSSVEPKASSMKFYYSFTMAKLGKEFDLLRVSEESVVNVELKSGSVTDEAVLHQLQQNKYYLATLGRAMHFYTYISQTDKLVRLTNSGRLIETDWASLAEVLTAQKDCYEGQAEDLFKEEEYLISPLTDPGRFLRGDYFLTSQQREIRNRILRAVMSPGGTVHRAYSLTGFTGLPGTGKSILLYDLAMQLSKKETVCVLHIGSYEKALEQLDERLKRVDFYYCDAASELTLDKTYAAILIDEGHRLSERLYQEILSYAKEWEVPVIATFDKEDAIPSMPGQIYGSRLITETEGYTGYRLTNRIRLNNELSSFIASLMRTKGRTRRGSYPSVTLLYANDADETEKLLSACEKEGYVMISDGSVKNEADARSVPISEAVCKEYDFCMMRIDETFYYDEDGYLREKGSDQGEEAGARVRSLFHGLSRAKKKIAVIVENNLPVFEAILSVLQDTSELP